MRVVAVVALFASVGLGACEDDRPLRLTIGVGHAEPKDRPAQVPAPVVFIDNVATTSFDRTYASNELALAETHTIELRHGDRVVRTRLVDLTFNSCLDYVGAASEVRYGYCQYESGDLRFRYTEAHGDGPCIGDGLCTPACDPVGCARDGQRCASLVTSVSPPASRLACVPIGPKQLGDSCALIDGIGGAHDDCGLDLLCVAGVCRRSCYEYSAGCAECDYVPGHAPELRVCM